MQEKCNRADAPEPRDATVSLLAHEAQDAHVARIAAAAAAVTAEREYVRAAWNATASSAASWDDLLRAYERVQGWALAGFSTRWLEECPHSVHDIRKAIARGRVPERRRPRTEPATYGELEWTIARGAVGVRYPLPKMPVVYRLFNEAGALIYIGSSTHLSARLRAHQAKPWAMTTARDAANKMCAEGLEAVAILTERPPLNAQPGAWGGALALAAAAEKAALLTPELRDLAKRLHRAVERQLNRADEQAVAS